jgi:hypothetical protein
MLRIYSAGLCSAVLCLAAGSRAFAQYPATQVIYNPYTGTLQAVPYNPYAATLGIGAGTIVYGPNGVAVVGRYGSSAVGVNPYTGYLGTATKAYDPVTGARTTVSGTYNPYTGGAAATSRGYDPVTGNVYGSTATYDPYTGTNYANGRSYNPATGQINSFVGSYNPLTGSGSYVNIATPSRRQQFGR